MRVMRKLSVGLESLSYLLSRIIKKSRLSAVRGSSIHRTSVAESGCQIINSSMARHSFCGYDCTILNAEIGAFCSIADRTYIGGSQHPIHFVSTSPVFLSHRDSVKAKFSRHEYMNLPTTKIGNDVWIGYEAKIRAGVTIGDGAVIGMGSVVTNDVAPYSIVAGVPAKEIRKRFSEDVIEKLLESEWWSYGDEELRLAAQHFN
eukprot:Opistho-2@61095